MFPMTTINFISYGVEKIHSVGAISTTKTSYFTQLDHVLLTVYSSRSFSLVSIYFTVF